VAEALPELVGQGFIDLLDRVYNSGDAYVGRAVPVGLQTAAGGGPEQRLLDFVYQPLTDARGKSTGIFVQASDVTERARAEAAMRESEERFRNLADHAPVMMWVTDPSGYCTYLNRRWYEFTGQSGPEAEGFGWLDTTHPDDKTKAETVFREANERHAPFRLEYRLRRADGVYRWAIDAAAPRFGPGGEFLGYVGSVIDIDERREIEEALRKSEAHLAAVFEQATAGFCETDFTGRFIAANARYCEIVGRAREELLSLRMQDITHPDDLSANLAQFERLAQQGEPFQIEKRYVRPDGSNIWVRNAVSVLRGADEQPDTVLAVTVDITERRRTEDALRQSEGRFEAIANSIDQLIWSTRPDGYHDYYNQRWYEYTGVPAGSTDGEAWNGMFHPNDQERAWAVWRHSLATGEPYHIEYRLRHRSGHYRWVLGRAQPVRDGNGRITRWFGTCTDIHDLKVAEEERARAVAELRELNETLERRVAERTADRDRM
jgi:PAS domain S-box-containing protein